MATFVKFANNAKSILASAISSSSTSFSVANVASADLFPAVSGANGTYFYATISDGTNLEIIRVGNRTAGSATFSSITRGREGTTAQTWPAGAEIELRLTAAGLSDATPSIDVQHFTVVGSTTWIKPAGARLVFIQAWGAGSGGGSGRRRAIAGQTVAAAGGAGGNGGGYREAWVSADAIGSTLSFTVPAGGAGGAPQTNDGTNGISGSGASNNDPYIGNVLTIPNQTSGGPGGDTSSTTGRPLHISNVWNYNDSVWGSYNGRGGAGFSSGSVGASQGSFGGGGGGGGAGYAANSTTGQSGGWGAIGASVTGVNQTGVNSGGTSGNPGNRTSVPADLNTTIPIFGGGGGGGGSTSTFTAGQASPAGQNGGKGGWPGGGGGGGSASQGANSGAGGDGGDGYVRITTFF